MNTSDWWISECTKFKKVLDLDSLWIDMNEPANFNHGNPDNTCPDTSINNPPYTPRVTGGALKEKTLCPETRFQLGRHYDVHNLYGWSMTEPSFRAARAMTGLRSHVYTRSAFPGCGKYASHWTGDNTSKWPHIHHSIIGILEFNIFGFPWVGADICGFLENTNEELCRRWHLLGAFYPFSRNHNGKGWMDQDPGAFGPEFAAVVRNVLRIRYTLLPVLYTLMHHSHVTGGTVARPLVHEFLSDVITHSIDRQFLWGASFLISPVLDQGAASVSAYFPDARWFSYYDGQEVAARGAFVELNAPADFIPLHMRGGYILPTQEPANSTVFSRNNPMGLIVALDDAGNAQGDLFWDDGETQDAYEKGLYYAAHYRLSDRSLSSAIQHDGYRGVDSLAHTTLRIFGESGSVTRVSVNGQDHTIFTYNPSTRVLSVAELSLPLNAPFTVTWS